MGISVFLMHQVLGQHDYQERRCRVCQQAPKRWPVIKDVLLHPFTHRKHSWADLPDPLERRFYWPTNVCTKCGVQQAQARDVCIEERNGYVYVHDFRFLDRPGTPEEDLVARLRLESDNLLGD